MVAPKAAGEYDSVKLEESMMKRWKDERTFARSIEYRSDGEPFIFLEGPPTANGRPGIHHVVARTYKDLVCRWKAMEGHFVERKGGWDTHGLPVEIEVQKRLDLMSNEAIEEFGIAEFNGLLSINSKASDYLNEWLNDERRNITIKNLLDMRSGLHRGCYGASQNDEIGNCNEILGASTLGGGDIAKANNQLTGCINQTFNTQQYLSLIHI